MKALTVRQPWAHAIMTGQKTIENRTWTTRYRGPLLIHASRTMAGEWSRFTQLSGEIPGILAFGHALGIVDLVDVVTRSESPWFEGPFGWVLANPRSFQPFALRGMPGLFEVPMQPAALEKAFAA